MTSRRKRTTKLATMAAVAAVAVTGLTFTSTAPAGQPVGGASSIVCDANGNCDEHATVQCQPRAFPWAGQCWTKNEGARFERYLRSRGSTPARFRQRWPRLAATFGPGWGVRPPGPARPCYSSGCARAVIRAVFPDRAEDYALRIASCETGGTFDPGAVGDGGSSIGLFQINYVWWSLSWVRGPGALKEAWHNSIVARRISGGGSDWSPWTCARYV